MIAGQLLSLLRCRSFWVLLLPLLLGTSALCEPARVTKKPAPVWIVFFSSRDCTRCTNVDDLIRNIGRKYRVRVKTFDIGKTEDYRLFDRLETIHGESKFAVPMLMLGESILIGEETIIKNLEKSVRRLSRSGGASLPYLGPSRAEGRDAPEDSSHCPECRRRPPSLGEEWNKIKKFMGGRL